MSVSMPVIRGTSTALYPFNQIYVCQTQISDGQAAYPTRNPKAYPLMRFEFPYDPLLQSNKQTLRSFFNSAKGSFTGATGSAQMTATTDQAYTDLGLDADLFAAAERNNTLYGVRWSVTQALPQNMSPGTKGAPYPTLANGSICQLVYTQQERFQTISSKVASGPKWTFAEFGGGLSNFPTGALMGWVLDEPILTDTDVTAKVAHFLNNWGMAYPFTFTDEWDATTATSINVTPGSYTITTQSGLISYPNGGGIYLLSRSSGANLQGTVTSYSGTTMVISISTTTGSGSYNDWNMAPVYSNVYYGSDQLTVQRLDINRTRITTTLVQMN